MRTFDARRCYSDIGTLLRLIHIDVEGGVIDVGGPGVVLRSKYSVEVVVHAIADHNICTKPERVTRHSHPLPSVTLRTFRPGNRVTCVEGVGVALTAIGVAIGYRAHDDGKKGVHLLRPRDQVE